MGSSATAAPADKDLGSFKSWNALSYTESGALACMMFSEPEKSAGKYTQRGDIYAFVTHRPASKSLNQVSFEAGYTFQKSSAVNVTIDQERYNLITLGSTAWSDESDVNNRIVQAMRADKMMIVRGTSSRGTETTDSYSLHGFSAAHQTINRACKVQP